MIGGNRKMHKLLPLQTLSSYPPASSLLISKLEFFFSRSHSCVPMNPTSCISKQQSLV